MFLLLVCRVYFLLRLVIVLIVVFLINMFVLIRGLLVFLFIIVLLIVCVCVYNVVINIFNRNVRKKVKICFIRLDFEVCFLLDFCF